MVAPAKGQQADGQGLGACQHAQGQLRWNVRSVDTEGTQEGGGGDHSGVSRDQTAQTTCTLTRYLDFALLARERESRV